MKSDHKLDILADVYVSGLKYYRGFGKIKLQENECMSKDEVVDLTSEFNELLRVYIDAEEKLQRLKNAALSSAEVYMRKYIEALDERRLITHKINVLKSKLSLEDVCEECEDPEEDV